MNTLDQVRRDISQRYDLKDSDSAISLDDVCNLIFSTNKKTIKNATIDKSSKLEFSSTSRKYLKFKSALGWLTDDERLNQVYLFTSQESFPTERITLKTLKQSVE